MLAHIALKENKKSIDLRVFGVLGVIQTYSCDIRQGYTKSLKANCQEN